MQQYLDLVRNILENGEERKDRTGVGTLSIFGTQTKYDLRTQAPLVTVKKTLVGSVVRELLWFLKGSTNINDGLKEYTPIWDKWADEQGELGPVYGHQWRAWDASEGRHIDQISQIVELIKTEPWSRRIIVSAWNVGELDKMALPPCHALFQFYVVGDRLDCQLYQRSADVALGVPFNIFSYGLLMRMVAQVTDLEPGIFTHTLGDAHIYKNHINGVEEMLTREPLPQPIVKLRPDVKNIFDFKFEDVAVENYKFHPFIKLPIAV